MTQYAHQALKAVIEFCSDKWMEADQPPKSGWPTSDMLTGKKMAFNEVLQFARKLMNEIS